MSTATQSPHSRRSCPLAPKAIEGQPFMVAPRFNWLYNACALEATLLRRCKQVHALNEPI